MTPPSTILILLLVVVLIILTIYGLFYIKYIYRLYFVVKDLHQILTYSKENTLKLYNNIQIIADNTENIKKQIRDLVYNIEANTTKPRLSTEKNLKNVKI